MACTVIVPQLGKLLCYYIKFGQATTNALVIISKSSFRI